jgi:AcrR family transcriptional regulator
MAERQERSTTTRALILDAAAHEFDMLGYGGASIGSIAARAGVAKGLIQYHFRTKAEIARTLVESTFRENVFMPPDGVGDRRGLAAIAFNSSHVARTFVENLTARASMRLLDERSQIEADLPVPYVGWIAVAKALLEQAQEDGEVPADIDAEAEAWILVAGTYGVEHVSARLNEFERVPERAARFLRAQFIALGATGVDALFD